MTQRFRLRLLGSVQLEQDGEPVHGFKSRKALALLGYLAAESQPVSRSYLVELFWPDKSETRGRNNLSQALHSLTTCWPDCFKANRQTVRFRRAAGWLDIRTFNELVAKGEPEALATAAELYQGDFMAGMYLDDCPDFEQWLRLEQETWRRRVTQVLFDLVNHYASHGNLAQALQFSSRLLSIDPCQEEAHRRKMLLLARSGQRSAALAQYETCRRFLRDELDVEPSTETVELFEQIKAGQISRQAQSPKRRLEPTSIFLSDQDAESLAYNNLPAQSTSFIGRETELAVISQYLENPTCRLPTIVGLGGIGKTRLALQAAAATEEFRHGVCFVPLASISSAEFLVSAIADALQFPLFGRGEPKARLLSYLRDKEMLLVMDNFEHLIAGATLLVEILQEAPDLKIMVTSRERLGLREEWVLDLQGLPFPESDKSKNLEEYSAVQLFLHRAQQVRADFWLTFLDKPAIAHICRLVEGLPLGIELAAAWTRTFPCQEIAAEIEETYDFLTASHSNLPERHQSLQAVFEHSWKLLSAEEQRVFRQLSIFRRGFSRKSAERVAGASAVLLSALVDKSLVRRTSAERYELHELLRQHVARKLAENPQELEKVRCRHCNYFAEFVQEQEAHLKRGNQKEALEAISAEIDNIRTGWYWAITHNRAQEIEQYLEGVFLFYQMRSRFHEGEMVFRWATTSLRKGHDAGDNRRGQIDEIFGRVLARQGLFCASMGDFDRARTIMQEGLAVFQNGEVRQEAALNLNYLGAIAMALGECDQARRLCRESLQSCREVGDRWGEALALEYLGLIAINLGEYVEAKEHAEASLAIFREFGYPSGVTGTMNILGLVARDLGEFAEGRQLCQESLMLAREVGDRWEEALSLEYLGKIAVSMGDYSEARELAKKSLAIFKEFDYHSGIMFSLNLLGRATRKLGQHTKARQIHRQVLQTSQSQDYPLGTLLASYHLGQTAYLLGDLAEAERRLLNSLELSKKLAYRRGVARSLNGLGRVTGAMGKFYEAKAYFCEALQTAQAIRAVPMALDILTGLAELLIKEGNAGRALDLLLFALHHTASERETRDKADSLFAQVEADVPEPVLEAARARAQASRLEEVAAAIINETAEGLLVPC